METPSGWVPIPTPERPVSPPKRINRVPLVQRRRTPEDPIHTEYQARMLDALYSPYAGHFALVMEIYKIASEEAAKPNAHVAWSWLVDDRKNKEYKAYMQLLSLPKTLLRPLIRNTLPYDSIHDPKVQAAVEKYMKVTSMPGIYCQALAINQGGLFRGPRTGKGWSRDQVEKLCQDIDLYLDSTAQGDQFGLLVDSYIPTGNSKHVGPASDPKDRRYCVNSRRAEQRQTLVKWKDLLRSQQSFDSTLRLDGAEPSMRARMEVGWSIDQEVRLSQHVDNGQTTHLWGLGQALSRMNWSAEYKTPYQWSLFRVWDRDQHLAQLSEHLGSVLCSAYSWEGGFNCIEAGTISFKDGPKANPSATAWDGNGTEIFITRKKTLGRLKRDHQELIDLRTKIQALPEKEAALKEQEQVTSKLLAEEAEALKEYYEVLAETERMKKELAELKLQVARSQESDPAAEKRKAALARAREHLAKVQKANKGTARPSSSRVPETPHSRGADVAPVTSISAPSAGEPPLANDDNGTLTNVTTLPSQPPSSLPPRSS